MKKLFYLVVSMSVFSITASAQFQAGAQVSYLTGHGKNDNHASLTGATVFGSYAIAGNMSIGSVIHVYGPKKSKYVSNGVSYYATDNVTNISGTYDVMLGTPGSIVQPYIGIDMGISSSSHKVEYTNNLNKTQKFNLKQTYVMLSPKIGVNIPLGPSLGLFSQAQYNFSPGDGGTTTVYVKNAKSIAGFTTEPISKYINIDTGVYMLLGNIKKIL